METPVLLALDTGSPKLSVALGRGGAILAEHTAQGRHAGERLLELVAQVLAEAGLDRRQLGGVVALRGPGSFTGLRIGLATALALSEALEIPATAVPTLRVLASTADGGVLNTAPPAPVVAAVDALRGEWFFQSFADGQEATSPERAPLARLAELEAGLAVGFGLPAACAEHPSPRLRRLPATEPPPLAAAALRLLHRQPDVVPWERALLSAPLYLRAPNIRLPNRAAGEL